MGSILQISSQLNTERTYLAPQAVLYKIERGEPVPLGEPGEQRWALPSGITVVEHDARDDDACPPTSTRSPSAASRERRAVVHR